MGLTGDEYGFAQPMAYTPALPAFEDLLKRHRTDLRSFVARRVTDPGLVDDIVQDTLLRAYRARAGFDGRRPVWPWLATIAKNTILNTLRGEKVRRSHLDRETDWRTVEGYADPRLANDPAKRYASKEQRAAIAEALAALDHRQRKVLLMRAAEGKSYEEIARAEGLSIDAVKSLLKRTRRTFRERYDEIRPEHGAPVIVPIAARLRGRVRAHYHRVRSRVEYAINIVTQSPGIDSLGQVFTAAGIAGALLLGVPSESGRAADRPVPSIVSAHLGGKSPSTSSSVQATVSWRQPIFKEAIQPVSDGPELALVGDLDQGNVDRRTVRIIVEYKVPGRDEGEKATIDIPCDQPVAGSATCDAADEVARNWPQPSQSR